MPLTNQAALLQHWSNLISESAREVNNTYHTLSSSRTLHFSCISHLTMITVIALSYLAPFFGRPNLKLPASSNQTPKTRTSSPDNRVREYIDRLKQVSEFPSKRPKWFQKNITNDCWDGLFQVVKLTVGLTAALFAWVLDIKHWNQYFSAFPKFWSSQYERA